LSRLRRQWRGRRIAEFAIVGLSTGSFDSSRHAALFRRIAGFHLARSSAREAYRNFSYCQQVIRRSLHTVNDSL